jgi:hypothetical protein
MLEQANLLDTTRVACLCEQSLETRRVDCVLVNRKDVAVPCRLEQTTREHAP